MIREMTKQDCSGVLEIYKMGIDTGNATFETNVPSWADWDAKHTEHSRFVYIDNGKIPGWGALSPVSSTRCIFPILKFMFPDSLQVRLG